MSADGVGEVIDFMPVAGYQATDRHRLVRLLRVVRGLVAIGVLVMVVFFRSVAATERAGREPLLSLRLFKNRTSNYGMVTQNAQWLVLMGVSFVVSAYLQVVRG